MLIGILRSSLFLDQENKLEIAISQTKKTILKANLKWTKIPSIKELQNVLLFPLAELMFYQHFLDFHNPLGVFFFCFLPAF